MQLETIRAVLTADSANFVTGFTRARGSLDGFTQRAGQSSRAMGIMRNGLVALATQATGVQSSVGRLAQGLLMFGGGGPLVLGVAAGIGALSLVYQGLTRDARENAEAQKELIKQLQGVGVHAQLTAAKIQLSVAQTAAEDRGRGGLGATLSQFGHDISGGMFGTGLAETLERRQRAVAAATIGVANAAKEAAKWTKQMADDAAREAQERARTASLLREVAELPTTALAESLFQREQAKLRLRAGAQIAQNETEKLSGDYFKFHARDIFIQSGISEDARQLGISVGRQFIMGMLEGVQSMQDLFRMVVMSLLDFGIGKILGGIFSGGASIASSAKDTTGPMKVSMSMTGLQPMTAYAVARDPAFQQVLREGILVAGSQGFKP